MAHTYYQPTEYEAQLIAAGWVTADTLDPDYVAYARHNEGMDYDAWLYHKRKWDALDAQYKAEIQPLYDREGYQLTRHEKCRAQELVKEMSWIEVLLGY